MINEAYAKGTSVIHRLDPRVKLIAVTLFSVLVALASRFSVLFLGLGFSIFLLFLARLPSGEILRSVKAVLLFLFVIWLVLPFTYDGPVLFRIGPISVMRPGAVLAARISIKSISIVLAVIALAATMPIADVGQALVVPLGELVALLVEVFVEQLAVAVLHQELGSGHPALPDGGQCVGTLRLQVLADHVLLDHERHEEPDVRADLLVLHPLRYSTRRVPGPVIVLGHLHPSSRLK